MLDRVMGHLAVGCVCMLIQARAPSLTLDSISCLLIADSFTIHVHTSYVWCYRPW